MSRRHYFRPGDFVRVDKLNVTVLHFGIAEAMVASRYSLHEVVNAGDEWVQLHLSNIDTAYTYRYEDVSKCLFNLDAYKNDHIGDVLL